MTSLSASPGTLPLVSAVSRQTKHTEHSSLKFCLLLADNHSFKFGSPFAWSPLSDERQAISLSRQRWSASVICAAALVSSLCYQFGGISSNQLLYKHENNVPTEQEYVPVWLVI